MTNDTTKSWTITIDNDLCSLLRDMQKCFDTWKESLEIRDEAECF